jgi:hypothetical protein
VMGRPEPGEPRRWPSHIGKAQLDLLAACQHMLTIWAG